MNKASNSPIPSAPAGVVSLEANGQISKIKWERFPAEVCESSPSPVPALQEITAFPVVTSLQLLIQPLLLSNGPNSSHLSTSLERFKD